MGSIFTVALCLMTFFSLASCASTGRAVATASAERSPEGDFKSFSNKEVNRQYVREKY